MIKDATITASFALVFAVSAVHWRSYACSIGLALCEARLGLLAHEAAHIGSSIQVLFDFAMGSHAQWKSIHHAGHHVHTNDIKHDPDIEVSPFMRVDPQQPLYWYHRHQWWYQWILFTLLPHKLRINGFIYVYRTFSKREIFIHHICAAPAIVIHILYPYCTYGIIGWTHYLFTCAVLGCIYGALFEVSHINELVQWRDSFDSRIAHQLATTCDWRPGCEWTNWLTVGLNNQAVHHVYSTRPSREYIALQEKLSHHAEYRSFKTFEEALRSNARHLWKMGRVQSP